MVKNGVAFIDTLSQERNVFDYALGIHDLGISALLSKECVVNKKYEIHHYKHVDTSIL